MLMRMDVNEKTEKRMRIEIKVGMENLVTLRSIMRFVQCTARFLEFYRLLTNYLENFCNDILR